MANSRERVAVVTGAARGNGKAIAKRLAQEGHTVYIADIAKNIPELPYALATEQELQATVEELRQDHVEVYPLVMDVRDASQVQTGFAEVERNHGQVGILVNNAGVLVLNPTPEVSEAEWQLQQDVIVKGAFLCARAVLPGMNTQKWGRIINVSSVAGHRAIGMGAAYTAAKHGLIGLTRALAMEVARQNVTVNAVCPGTVPTALTHSAGQLQGLEMGENFFGFSDRHMTGQTIQSEDVANAVAWLASEEAERVNGTSLFVDDGWHAH